MPIERVDPPMAADERMTLTAFLDYHRETLRQKCQGLTPAQLLVRAVPPSDLCLLGLLRHLADVERSWLAERLAGGPVSYLYGPGDGDLEVTEADDASVAAVWATFDAQLAISREITASHSLDAIALKPTRQGERPSLRWILVHLIEEYARHNGHADLIRQSIDGATGE
ncbi:DinB family protein [Jatrophihabitans sp. DSM 45814]